MSMIGNDWDDLLAEEFKKDYYQQLRQFLKEEYRTKTIYPEAHNIFNALKYTPYSEVKVVILGQDPYINPGEAHGLAFSVQPGANIPPSLLNIFKELETDIGCYIPNNGHLVHWAKQGVLLLNTVLTVEHGKSKSHAGKGWEQFTDRIIDLLDLKENECMFMLWGRMAQQKGNLLPAAKHFIFEASHPSPLAGGKFFGCKHFSRANKYLATTGQKEIDWQIPNI